MEKRKPSIIFFHPMNDFTGSTSVLASIIKDEFSGYEVAVLSNFKYEGSLTNILGIKKISYWAPEFRKKYIPIVTTVISRIHMFILALWYGRHYDIFYINTFKPEYAAIVGKLYGKKIIYHIHEKYSKPNLGQRFSEYVFNHAKAKKIFVSKYVSKQYPHNPGAEYVIRYNKLSRDFVENIKITPIKFRKRTNVLFVSSMVLQKGIDKLVPLAKILPQFTFTVIFSSNEVDINHFFKNDIPTNLNIYPKQSDIHSFLREADVLINLSNPDMVVETFGMTILEAMAYGIPSVVPNIGGPTELIKDGYNGYCVDTTNIHLIADAIIKTLSEEEYARLCENAIKQYETFK